MPHHTLSFYLLLANLTATLLMTGIIWFVQIVHYPLFGSVGEADYARYHTGHARLTGFVVAPPMFVELATSILLVFHPPSGIPGFAVGVGVVLVAVLWLSTFLLQVPRHNRLGNGYDSTAHRALVTTNWLRTVAWTLRAALVLWMLTKVFGHVN